MKTFRHLWQYLAECFLKWEMFQINAVDKMRMFNNVFFSENRAAYGAREAADDNMAARCIMN